YDSVHIDMSKESLEDNIEVVREVVAYGKGSVEGELGYLVTDSSKVYDNEVSIPPESLTDPAAAADYVEKTGINRLAAAVGSLHGIAANTPSLDLERIEAIRKKLPSTVALVLHGGSGVTDDDFRKAISLGVNNIHISTDLRVAYTNALRKVLDDNPDETTPYKFYAPVIEAVKEVALEKIKLFGADGKK
ncbi:MAG: class II fructose-bisphosphate aldolase, partial [bacterium]|nr:class II fructose-bisphosphate aldolase [bacterium]